MKITALDSFATAELGMVHAGTEINVSAISEARLTEWAKRGFIPKTKKEPAPLNKAEMVPLNKSEPVKQSRKGN